MAVKLGDITQEICREILGYEDPEYMNLLAFWANDAIEDMLYETRWDFNINPTILATITGGDQTLIVSSEFGESIAIRIPSINAAINFITKQELIDVGADFTATIDYPRYYWIEEWDKDSGLYTLGFYPRPTSDLGIEIASNKPITFLENDDAIPFPDGFKSVLKYKVLGRAYTINGQTEAGAYNAQEHYTQLDRRRINKDTKPYERRYKSIQDLPHPVDPSARIPRRYY